MTIILALTGISFALPQTAAASTTTTTAATTTTTTTVAVDKACGDIVAGLPMDASTWTQAQGNLVCTTANGSTTVAASVGLGWLTLADTEHPSKAGIAHWHCGDGSTTQAWDMKSRTCTDAATAEADNLVLQQGWTTARLVTVAKAVNAIGASQVCDEVLLGKADVVTEGYTSVVDAASGTITVKDSKGVVYCTGKYTLIADLAAKASTTDLTNGLAQKADATAVDAALNKKADADKVVAKDTYAADQKVVQTHLGALDTFAGAVTDAMGQDKAPVYFVGVPFGYEFGYTGAGLEGGFGVEGRTVGFDTSVSALVMSGRSAAFAIDLDALGHVGSGPMHLGAFLGVETLGVGVRGSTASASETYDGGSIGPRARIDFSPKYAGGLSLTVDAGLTPYIHYTGAKYDRFASSGTASLTLEYRFGGYHEGPRFAAPAAPVAPPAPAPATTTTTTETTTATTATVTP